jgi:arylsulfatase A-like enzyme
MFAGSAVCAPTRACFLTGKHSGHTSVRLNGGGTPLRAGEATIASLLKPLGYATGGFGKWGAGGRGSTGVPEAARLRRVLRLLRPGPRALVLPALPDPQQRRGAAARQQRAA